MGWLGRREGSTHAPTPRRRYAHDIIYTHVGDILIAVNPFKEISHLYEYVLSVGRIVSGGVLPYLIPLPILVSGSPAASRMFLPDLDPPNLPHVFRVAQVGDPVSLL